MAPTQVAVHSTVRVQVAGRWVARYTHRWVTVHGHWYLRTVRTVVKLPNWFCNRPVTTYVGIALLNTDALGQFTANANGTITAHVTPAHVAGPHLFTLAGNTFTLTAPVTVH